MNRWALYLSQTPVTLQRLIARHNRISLPHGCTAADRLQRLRTALMHQRTVRVTYFGLDAPTRQAVQALRHHTQGINADTLQHRYGPVRPWRDLASDPRPRSIAEKLILLGWLLPRSAHPRRPARFLLVPDVRRWLPHPLDLPLCGHVAPPDQPPPAVHATAVLLLAAATRSLTIRQDGTLTAASLRLLTPRLRPETAPAAPDLYRFLLPLICEQGWLDCRAGQGRTTAAGQRYLARPQAAQRHLLQHAWLTSPTPDAWLKRLLIPDRGARGIDWPVLRQRLCAWVAALPFQQAVPLDGLHTALAAALGPLADAQTHGYQPVQRAPWQPRRAEAIFTAALAYPFTWLGVVQQTAAPLPDGTGGTCVARLLATDAALGEAGAAPQGSDPAQSDAKTWQYGEPGSVHIPHQQLTAAVLKLLPYAAWHATTSTATEYRITSRTLAAAIRQGHSPDALWTLLDQQAGPLPMAWNTLCNAVPASFSLSEQAVLQTDHPAQLTQAATHRSIRRYLGTRIAPGIALVPTAQVPGLTRTLARHGIPLQYTADRSSTPPPALPDTDIYLSPADCAALLLACTIARQHTPDDAPFLPHPWLEARLRAALPPAMLHQLEQAHTALCAPSPPVSHAPVPVPCSLEAARPLLERAIRQRQTLTLDYTAADGTQSTRPVRPLHLHQHGEYWYLRAYCTLAQDERTFRLDRVQAITPDSTTARSSPARSRVPECAAPLPHPESRSVRYPSPGRSGRAPSAEAA